MGLPVHARSRILEEIVQTKVAWKQRDRMKPGLDYNMDWVDKQHQLLAASWPSLTKMFHSFLKHQPTEEQICAHVVPPGLGGRILLLRIPHTLVIGHGGIMTIDKKASSLWTSFQGTRRWYAGRWGERMPTALHSCEPYGLWKQLAWQEMPVGTIDVWLWWSNQLLPCWIQDLLYRY